METRKIPGKWATGLFSLTLWAASASAQEVHRCEVDGRTVYQALPCAEAKRAVAPSPINLPTSDISDAEHKSLREKADARRAEEARKREVLQKGFVTSRPAEASAAAVPPPSLPRFDPNHPCEITDFFERLNAYKRRNPAMASLISATLDQHRYQIGTPLDLFMALSCDGIESINATRSAAGESIQYVMRRHALIWARYVYVNGGMVTTVQE